MTSQVFRRHGRSSPGSGSGEEETVHHRFKHFVNSIVENVNLIDGGFVSLAVLRIN
jgi:hypothetical protein